MECFAFGLKMLSLSLATYMQDCFSQSASESAADEHASLTAKIYTIAFEAKGDVQKKIS